jgi:hypothetical protein
VPAFAEGLWIAQVAENGGAPAVVLSNAHPAGGLTNSLNN